jgi:hypothetical protein
MKTALLRLAGRAADLAQTQPLLAVCLGAALLAMFLSLWTHPAASAATTRTSLPWTLYHMGSRLLFAALAILLLTLTLGVLRTYLRKSVMDFQQTHGRVTEANYNAVQTIWGAEQTQRELTFKVYYDEEVTERTEFEDTAKPAILRKKSVRRSVPGNPFISAAHDVTLTQNPRRKGSALYGGYETACRFTWKLRSPADRATSGTLRFPLPAQGAMYDELAATVNGVDVLPVVELSEAALLLTRDLKANEELDVAISFKSRGMSQWYFQVTDQREIRDFSLALTLPDLPRAKLNYPEGCMSPSDLKPTTDGRGSVLRYHLDHAISQKGMGISLPALPQPGATTTAVLEEAERGWMLVVATLFLTLALGQVKHASFIGTLFAIATALIFGLLGDCSDLLLGFVGATLLVVLPLLLFLAFSIRRIIGGKRGNLAAVLMLVFALAYPAAAGLDGERQSLYLNICGFLFLAVAAWQWAQDLRVSWTDSEASPELTQPAVPLPAASGKG